jgi:hypothetical protein
VTLVDRSILSAGDDVAMVKSSRILLNVDGSTPSPATPGGRGHSGERLDYDIMVL